MDWKKHIATLQDRGFTQQQIARECGCAQASVCDLAHGRTKEPRYAVGAKILELIESTTAPASRARAATKTEACAAAGNEVAGAHV